MYRTVLHRISTVTVIALCGILFAFSAFSMHAAHAQGFDFSDPDLAAEAEEAIGGAVIGTSCDDPSRRPGEPCLTEESTVLHPIGDTTIQNIIGRVINAILGLVGVLALVMFIYGGVTWMLAAGNTEKIAKAKNTLIWAVLGLVVVFAAYAIVSFVIDALGG